MAAGALAGVIASEVADAVREKLSEEMQNLWTRDELVDAFTVAFRDPGVLRRSNDYRVFDVASGETEHISLTDHFGQNPAYFLNVLSAPATGFDLRVNGGDVIPGVVEGDEFTRFDIWELTADNTDGADLARVLVGGRAGPQVTRYDEVS